MSYQRGVFWGVVPYTPAAPFEVKFMRTYEQVDSAPELARELKRQDLGGAFPFSVLAKIRPLLAISEPSAELRDVVGLTLVNISRRVRQKHLTEENAKQIVAGEHPYLFHLGSETTRLLGSDTYAAAIDSPISLNESAFTTKAIGEINDHEFAVLCQRFVEKLGFDLTMLIDERARQLLDQK